MNVHRTARAVLTPPLRNALQVDRRTSRVSTTVQVTQEQREPEYHVPQGSKAAMEGHGCDVKQPSPSYGQLSALFFLAAA